MTTTVQVPIEQLNPGDVLARPVFDGEGHELIASGIALTAALIEKLHRLGVLSVSIVGEPSIESELRHPDLRFLKEKTRRHAEAQIESTLDKLSTDGPLDLKAVAETIEAIISDIFDKDEIVLTLHTMLDEHRYMYEHSVNVAVLSLVMGIYLGFDKDRLRELGIGAILHDIGKITIPTEVLDKKGQLTDEEFERVKSHSTAGYDLVSGKIEMAEESREILRYHHERVDGSGYPDGLRGDEIPVYAKIVGLVDVFDAITSVKVYNRPMNPYHAMRYLAVNSGVKFDRSLIKRFWQLMGYYPEGTRLYLTNGCYGVVTRRGRFTPEVRVIREGDDSVPETPYLIDLGVNRNVGIYRIDLEGETATG
jgi:HD-GYP domain-containing protein (c-di-GMP phosphodiesterase class II)